MNKKLMLMMFAALSAANIFGQQEKLVLTVDEAVNLALKNNQTLKSSAIDLEIKKRASDYSWNKLLPGVSASISYARTNENTAYKTMKTSLDSAALSTSQLMAVANGEYNPMNWPTEPYPDLKNAIYSSAGFEEDADYRNSFVGSLGISWNFSAALISNIKLSKAQYEAGVISWEKANSDMEINIRKLFYGLLLAQESLNIQKESLANSKARCEQAQINYKNGLVPELQVLNTQVSYENMKPTVTKAEQGLAQQFNLFAFMLGLDYGTKIELKGTFDVSYIDVNAEDIIVQYCEESNDIVSLRKNIEIAKIGLNALNLSTFTPAISVNWGYKPTLYALGTNYLNPENIDSMTDSGALAVTVVFTDLVGMLPFSSNYQKILDTKRNIQKAELGLDIMVKNAEVEIHKLVDNLEISRQNIEAMQRNVGVAKRAYDSTLKSFNSGTQEWLSVKESDAALSQAQLGLMSEKYNYISAVLELENKIGKKITK